MGLEEEDIMKRHNFIKQVQGFPKDGGRTGTEENIVYRRKIRNEKILGTRNGETM